VRRETQTHFQSDPYTDIVDDVDQNAFFLIYVHYGLWTVLVFGFALLPGLEKGECCDA